MHVACPTPCMRASSNREPSNMASCWGKDAWASWRVAVATPDPAGASVVISLVRGAVATSAGTEQHVEIDGVRYSHIVDPRTGLGLTARRSVTVIAPDGATADALAYIDQRLDRMGVHKMLQRAGVSDGDVVWIGDFSFEYQPDL